MENHNIIEYLKWRGDLSFEICPFNEIDGIILAMAAYLDFDKEVDEFPSNISFSFNEVIDKYFVDNDTEHLSLGLIIPNEVFKLTEAIKNSKRFKDIRISNFVNKVDVDMTEQFSALVFHLNEKEIYITYRGTDDSLVGWVEDIHLIANFPIAAQKSALNFFETICELYPNTSIYVGGHSKGGNLSIYSSTYCKEEYKNRIKRVYSFDGPGFDENVIDEERFSLIKNKVVHVLPQFSIVGRFFELDVDPLIVKSFEKGLNQHNPFNWQVEYGEFKKEECFTPNSEKINRDIKNLTKQLSKEEKSDFALDIKNYVNSLDQDHLLEFLNPISFVSLFSNKYKIKHKNIRLLVKLYRILFRYRAISIKFPK